MPDLHSFLHSKILLTVATITPNSLNPLKCQTPPFWQSFCGNARSFGKYSHQSPAVESLQCTNISYITLVGTCAHLMMQCTMAVLFRYKGCHFTLILGSKVYEDEGACAPFIKFMAKSRVGSLHPQSSSFRKFRKFTCKSVHFRTFWKKAFTLAIAPSAKGFGMLLCILEHFDCEKVFTPIHAVMYVVMPCFVLIPPRTAHPWGGNYRSAPLSPANNAAGSRRVIALSTSRCHLSTV